MELEVSDAETSTKDIIRPYLTEANPASEALNVNVPTGRGSEISIYDMKGRLVFEDVTNSNSFTWELADKSGNRVQSGVYIVKIASDESNIVKKVLVK